MNPHLKQLIEISLVDKEIDSFNPKINSINAQLEAQQRKINRLELSIKEIEEQMEESAKARLQNEIYISTYAERINEIGRKGAMVKSEREATALRLEEDIAREQLKGANEMAEKLDKSDAAKKAEIDKLKEEISSQEESFAGLKTAAKAELEEIDKLRAGIYKNKEAVIKTINQKILGFYEKIRAWAGNSVVVPVRKQACYGCFMRLSEKVCMDVLKGDEISTCPHCGRILYNDGSGNLMLEVVEKPARRASANATAKAQAAAEKAAAKEKAAAEKAAAKEKAAAEKAAAKAQAAAEKAAAKEAAAAEKAAAKEKAAAEKAAAKAAKPTATKAATKAKVSKDSK